MTTREQRQAAFDFFRGQLTPAVSRWIETGEIADDGNPNLDHIELADLLARREAATLGVLKSWRCRQCDGTGRYHPHCARCADSTDDHCCPEAVDCTDEMCVALRSVFPSTSGVRPVEKLIRAIDVPQHFGLFRKRTGTYVHVRISESAVKVMGLDQTKVWAVSVVSGSVSKLEPATLVAPCVVADIEQNAQASAAWERAMGVTHGRFPP